ncbi:MAG: hypothetical protein AB7H77_09275 [Bdellovibrionales bacterium]
MFVITINGRPANMQKLSKYEGRVLLDHNEADRYLCASTQQAAMQMFLFHFGFTWEERAEGIECESVYVLKPEGKKKEGAK